MRAVSLRTIALASLLVPIAWVGPVRAQEPTEPPPSSPLPAPPPADPIDAPPAAPPTFEPTRSPEPVGEPEISPPRMSEGRLLVSLYNSGFHWGIAPGLVFVGGKAGFFLGLRVGYGIDTGSVIVVPGARLAGYFTDPNVYTGLPTMKLVVPIDAFAPFLEGGAGVGYVGSDGNAGTSSKTGLALLAGAGAMYHFSSRFALGVEGNYQVITGTSFKGFGAGPIIAIGF